MRTDKLLFTLKMLCALALICAVCALALASNAEVLLVQARGGLNVRESPSIEAKIVYLLDDCETVIVAGRWQPRTREAMRRWAGFAAITSNKKMA